MNDFMKLNVFFFQLFNSPFNFFIEFLTPTVQAQEADYTIIAENLIGISKFVLNITIE